MGSSRSPHAAVLWRAGLFELVVASLMFTAPSLFAIPAYAWLSPHLVLAGLLMAAGGGAALFAVSGFCPRHVLPVAPLLAAVPLAMLVVNFSVSGAVSGVITYGVELTALVWVAWLALTRRAAPGRVYVLMVGAVVGTIGLSMVAAPEGYAAAVYWNLADGLVVIAPLFVVGGFGLLAAEVWSASRRLPDLRAERVVLAFAALAAVDLAVLVGTFTATGAWTGVANYGLMTVVLLLATPRMTAHESPILFASLAAVAAAADLATAVVMWAGGPELAPSGAILRPAIALGLLYVAVGFALALHERQPRRRLTVVLAALGTTLGIFALTAGAGPASVPAPGALLGQIPDSDMAAGTFSGPAVLAASGIVLLLVVARPRARLVTQALLVFSCTVLGIVALNLLAYMLQSPLLLEVYGPFALRQHATLAFGALAIGTLATGTARIITAPLADRFVGVFASLAILVLIRGYVADAALAHVFVAVDDVGNPERLANVEAARQLMLFILLGVTAGAAVVMTRTVTLPLGELLRAIARTRAGVARAQADVDGSDEIGTVARSFNQLTRELADQSELNAAIEHAQSDLGEAIVVLERGEPRRWNEALATISGHTDIELHRMPSILQLWPADERADMAALLRSRTTETYRFETRIMRRSGEVAELEIAVIPLRNTQSGEQLAIMRDISERKQAERALRRLALHDALTELPNRALFADRLERTIAAARRASDCFALLYLDVDRFKQINDAFGHDGGDDLLRQLAHRLTGALASTDTLARFGGDEFAVLLPNARTELAAIAAAETVRAVLQRPFELGGHSVFVEASIGTVVFPTDGADAETLLRHADIAMYEAKHSGKVIVAYAVEHEPQSRQRLALMSDLRHAIERDELELHYQPFLRVVDGACCAALEALVRWRHPVRGMVAPADFIPLAEESGFINELALWVIRQATRQVAALRTLGVEPRVAINLSARNLHLPGLVDAVSLSLAESGLAPSDVTFEITETSVMSDTRRSLDTLTRLALLGARISIDDFGTGYSSLAYLRRLPVTELKIDRSFVSDMLANPSSDAIVTSTIQLGHSLGLTVVAEGVEDATTLEALAARGCDLAQGYHIARPMPFDVLAEFLLARKRPVDAASAAD